MNLVTTPLRYPGGKGKLTSYIKMVFEENELLDGNYVEPYAGGAGIALNLLMLGYVTCVHLNDLDPAVFAFWYSVINSTEDLCKMVRDVKLDMTEWKRQKAIHGDPKNHSKLELGFSTFFLNRTNRSGIISGGVIGGNNQAGTWKMDARFNRVELSRRIERIAFNRSRIRIYNLDASKLISDVLPSLPKKTLVYFDPPYYLKADRLYGNHYNHSDHVAVSKLVRSVNIPWIVSYDCRPEIVAMYEGLPSIIYGMNYSAADRYQGSEVMFFNPSLIIPNESNPASLRAAA